MFLLEQKTKKTHWFKNSSSGVTLLEVLLVTVAIGILVGLVFAALNPVRFFQDNRDNQREVHLHDLQVAFAQLLAEEEGVFPAGITTVPKEICNTGKTPGSAIPQPDCGNMVNLSMLVPAYIPQIPKDPQGGITASLAPEAHAQAVGTGYFISKGEGNRLVIQAPRSENRPVGIGKIYNPYSLEFDGVNERTTMSQNAVLQPKNVTVVLWLKPHNTTDRGFAFRQHLAWMLQYFDGTLRWRTWYDEGGSRAQVQHTAINLDSNNWYYVALTITEYDVTKQRIFGPDGVVHESVQSFLGPIWYENVLSVLELSSMGWWASGDTRFAGPINNVRIYNRALSEQEIKNLYNGIHIPNGLVGWWNFNEGEGTTTEDLSGNENHGTLHGGVTWTEDTP